MKYRKGVRLRNCVLVMSLLSVATGMSPVFAQAPPALDAVRVATGLSAPIFVTAPPGDYSRLFIVQLNGQIKILNLATGIVNPTPFLSITVGAKGEQGLLGLAFDADYNDRTKPGFGKFYIHYVADVGNGVTHVEQRQVSSDADVADTTAASIKTLLTVTQPQTNHNGGWIGFSPRPDDDHNLYIALGDGGSGNDADGGVGHHEPGGNAQWNQTLLGKMLRIHVDPASGTYSVPSNNPFAGSTDPDVKQEIWLLGLRNPFRDSFDRQTGRMFIGDVGQSTREEIDVQQAANPSGGENYGWRDREGFIQNPAYPTPAPGPTPTPNPPRVDPVMDFDRSHATTIIGGYVYRGKQIPAWDGTYVFADYGFAKIYTFNYDGGALATNLHDITPDLFPTASGGFTLGTTSGLGEDANGEIYITDINKGAVFRIVPVTPNVKIDSSFFNGTVFTGTGTGVPFTSVTVKSTSDLTQPFGSPVSAAVAGDGTFQFVDRNPGSARFYRVTYP